jgi:S-adenosylmethionine hydrolase
MATNPRGRSVLLHRPTVTLLTDFGTRDAYVASMKAVLIRECPEARLIDITHEVPRHDVQCGSITLERAVDGFPAGTVHLAIVDPGVGTQRRLLIVELAGQIIVCPDNGLITWAWRRHGGGKAHEITWRPEKISNVFHGRDIFAPIAGKLAAGHAIRTIARPIDDLILLDMSPADEGAASGCVIHVDHFGNATTNLLYDRIRKQRIKTIRIKGKSVGTLKRTYHDVAPGKPLALIGSSGLVEIAVRDGSAAERMKIRVGDPVSFQ